MYKNMLNKNFFNKNAFEEMSAEKLVYSIIEMPQLSEMARNFVVNITYRAEEEAKSKFASLIKFPGRLCEN